jgi:hypothetical protein
VCCLDCGKEFPYDSKEMKIIKGDMKTVRSLSPPSGASFILYLFPPQHWEPLIGDLKERFTETILPAYGRFLACVWYWWQVGISVFPFLARFLKRVLGITILLKLIGK